MSALYKKKVNQGFTILAFPCNQFGAQEPKGEAEIKEFVKKFDVEFPMFSKIDVNGPKTHHVYKFLKGAFPGDITWNFAAKFLIDREGRPIRRFGKAETFEEIDKVIDQVLAEPDKQENSSTKLKAGQPTSAM